MAEPREQKYLDTIAQFPSSPLGYFSLGRFYLEQARFLEAADALRQCVERDPNYAAALLSLGDALAGAAKPDQAREAYARGKQAALAQNHPSLAEEIDERVEELA